MLFSMGSNFVEVTYVSVKCSCSSRLTNNDKKKKIPLCLAIMTGNLFFPILTKRECRKYIPNANTALESFSIRILQTLDYCCFFSHIILGKPVLTLQTRYQLKNDIIARKHWFRVKIIPNCAETGSLQRRNSSRMYLSNLGVLFRKRISCGAVGYDLYSEPKLSRYYITRNSTVYTLIRDRSVALKHTDCHFTFGHTSISIIFLCA